jgi:DNA invertase Pin-like site-specific DNA recombinase
VDESAYYEYVLKRPGIRVHYCAEQFENDGSMSSVLKTLKSSMAAEYSRELSVKVFSGQCRLIKLGFRQGGSAGYGLHRRLIDRDRIRKACSVWANGRAFRPVGSFWSPDRKEKLRRSPNTCPTRRLFAKLC